MGTPSRVPVVAVLSVLLAGCAAGGSPSPSLSVPSSNPAAASSSPALPSPSPSVSRSPSPARSAQPPSGDRIDVHGVAFFDRLHGLLVGGSGWDRAVGVVWQTSDGGNTWAKSTADTGPLDAVAVAGSGTAWMASACDLNARPDCVPGLYQSNDGGAEWTRISAQRLIALSFPSASVGWAVAPEPASAPHGPNVLMHSIDGGRTWTRRPVACPPTTGTPVAVSFPDALHGWVACNGTVGAGMATKAILATTDGGTAWTVMASSPIPGQGKDVGSIAANGYLSGIAMAADGHGMVWMGRGVTERTVDGGRTWIDMPPGEWDAREAEAGWVLDDHDWLLYVWNGTDHGPALEVTHDAGRSWTVVGLIPPPPTG